MITGEIIKRLPPSLREKIEKNKELRAIVGNINWLTFENILRGVLNLIILALVARYLGPEKLGVMTYAYAFVTLFSGLSTLGLDSIVVRNILNNETKKNKYLGTTFILKLTGSVLMLLLSLLMIQITKPGDSVTFLFVLIIVLGYLFKPFDAVDFWFQSEVKSKYSVIARITGFLVITTLKFVFIEIKAPLASFVYLYSVEFLITSLVLIYFYFKKTGKSLFQWKFDKKIALSLMADSWPLFLGAITSMIYMKVDQVIIGNILGDKEVSFYYTAAKLSETWYFFPTVIGASVFPSILNSKKRSEKEYKDRLQKLFDLSTWAGILIAILITLCSRFIVELLYGEEYMVTADVLSIHIWSGIFVFSGIIASKWVVVENLTKNALVRSILTAVLNVLLNLVLIKQFGIIGAAISTLLSYAFVGFLSLAFWKKTRECFMMELNSFNIFRISQISKIGKYIYKNIKLGYFFFYYEIRNKFSSKIGISSEDSAGGFIVSLTSYPKRFNIVHLTLESLLDQTKKPDKIILWLSKEEANDDTLPIKILRLKDRGVDIRYLDGNIKSYKKLIYALKEFPDKAVVTVDDDTIYPRGFLKKFYREYKNNKEDVLACRCTYIENDDQGKLKPYIEWRNITEEKASLKYFPTGVGGILYPPGSLNSQVFNQDLFTSLCPTADDVWFKAMTLLNKRNVRNIKCKEIEFLSIKKAQKESLWKVNVGENKNDKQIKDTFDYFDLYKYLD